MMADQIDYGIAGRFPTASDGTYEEETLPSRARSSSRQRPRNFRLCYDEDRDQREWNDMADSNYFTGNTGFSRPEPWGVAPIDFLYSIETDTSPSALAPRVTYTIVSSVSAAIIDSIYEHDCPPQQRRRRRRRQQALSDWPSSSALRSRRMEILSISPGDVHEWLGECDTRTSTTNTNIDEGSISLFCNKVEGIVVIGFDEMNFARTKVGSGTSASDFKSVGDVVLSRIREDMISGKYLERVNRDVFHFGVKITNMKYIDSDYPNLVNQNAFAPISALTGPMEANFAAADSTEMTLFSKVAIPLIVLLSILATVLCWCAITSWPTDWLSERKKNILKQKSKGVGDEEEDILYKKNSPEDHGHYVSRNYAVPPATITIRTKDSSSNIGRNSSYEEELLEFPSILRTPSVEATLQDLSETEMIKYGRQGATYPMESRNRTTYSTIPIDDNRTGVNRFLPISIRTRNQSMVHVTDGSSHPSDTETGSTPSDETNNYDGRDHSKETSNDDLGKIGNRGSIVGTSVSTTKLNRPSRPQSRGFMSSIFSKRSTPTPTINLVERVNACTPVETNACLGDEAELPPPMMHNNSNNRTDNNTILTYAVPNDGRCNSLVDLKKSEEDAAKSPSSRMSAKKAAAYRAYISKKMLQHTEECDNNGDQSIPFEIGKKRTFTDERGRIREMVAL